MEKHHPRLICQIHRGQTLGNAVQRRLTRSVRVRVRTPTPIIIDASDLTAHKGKEGEEVRRSYIHFVEEMLHDEQWRNGINLIGPHERILGDLGCDIAGSTCRSIKGCAGEVYPSSIVDNVGECNGTGGCRCLNARFGGDVHLQKVEMGGMGIGEGLEVGGDGGGLVGCDNGGTVVEALADEFESDAACCTDDDDCACGIDGDGFVVFY